MLDKLKEKYRFVRNFVSLHLVWRQLRRQVLGRQTGRKADGDKRLLILPADVRAPFGSRGDQAMILATVAQYKKKYPGLEVCIITSSKNDDFELRSAGITPLLLWHGDVLEKIVNHCVGHFDFFVVVGADCMDGYYGPLGSINYFAAADLMACANVDVRVLGFSFNASPSPYLRTAVRLLNPNIKLRLRDQVSLDRFRRFCGFQNTELVADAAFCLEPDGNFPEFDFVAEWCGQQRGSARKIIGVNYHSMFPHLTERERINKWLVDATQAWSSILEDKHLAVILLPHDNRPGVNDNIFLAMLYERLVAQYPDRVYWCDRVFRADQIKSIVGLVDCVFSCRMHLAIASLGQGVPVMSFVYQGKFEGLWQLFGLPCRYCLEAPNSQPEHFLREFRQFLQDNCELRDLISARLPHVRMLAEKNFKDIK